MSLQIENARLIQTESVTVMYFFHIFFPLSQNNKHSDCFPKQTAIIYKSELQ